MDLNLAPLRYRNILCRDGGPIEKIEVSQHGSPEIPQFEAVAFLNGSLLPPGHAHSAIYSGGHGGGTNQNRNVACHIAISEALERWAFLETVKGTDAAIYGFNSDPSTSGMAAFPGLTSETARTHSNWEAIERWALAEWWLYGLPMTVLPGSDNNKGCLKFFLPFKSIEMLLMWETIAAGRTGYGFAAAKDISRAAQKAQVELDRNLKILRRFYGQNEKSPHDFIFDQTRTTYDRRTIYFSTTEGAELFHTKAKANSSPKDAPPEPPKIIDREIPGPWSRYAKVWRTLYLNEKHRDVHSLRHDIFVF